MAPSSSTHAWSIRVNIFLRALRSRLGRPCLFAAAVALPFFLSACGGGGDAAGSLESANPGLGSARQDAMDPAHWELGPLIQGMPLHPFLHVDGQSSGWAIDLPNPTREAGSVHYVTTETGSLVGKTKISMRFRVEADAGVKIVPRNFPASPSILTLYFQREGDDWSARGAYETYRWYATFASHMPIQPGGEYTVEARFDQNWTAVLTSSRSNNPSGFQAALADAGRIGFVLGGGDGYGHGVYATGRARLVVTSFRVE
jgi:hypothetical protein